MEKILNFFDEEGKLKDKADIDKMVDNLYQELADNIDKDSDYLSYSDTIVTPDFQFSPDIVKKDHDFLQRNLYLSELILSKTYESDESLPDRYNAIAQELSEKIIMYNQMDDKDNIPIEDRVPIRIYVNTDGGEITEALQLIDTIMLSHTPIITYGMGKVYSAGLVIFLAANKRYAFPHSSYLMHEGCSNYGGDAQKFDSWSDFYKKLRKQLKDLIVFRTNISSEEYETLKKDDVWYTADEAFEKGIATSIMTKGY